MSFHKSNTICFIIFEKPLVKNKTLVRIVINYLLRLVDDTFQNLLVHKIIDMFAIDNKKPPTN